MHILCETNIPPRYSKALERVPWATVARVDDILQPEVDDKEIAEFAEACCWVVLTRDSDFFKLAGRYDFGILYLAMWKDPAPGKLVEAIEKIKEGHADYSDITESIPGDWI